MPRIRISDAMAAAIHRRAIRESRSDQSMHDKIVRAGLLAIGDVLITNQDEPGMPNDPRQTFKLTLRLPLEIYGEVKERAKSEGRSGRSMICRLLESGLRTSEEHSK
jgi:hypothetical protein